MKKSQFMFICKTLLGHHLNYFQEEVIKDFDFDRSFLENKLRILDLILIGKFMAFSFVKEIN